MLLLPVLLGLASWKPDEPRWLRLCDKGPGLESGSRAWQDAPLRGDLLDSLEASGWTVRNTYRWENLVSAVPTPAARRLPSCVEDVGPVARAIRTPVPAGTAGRSLAAPRIASVDPFTIAMRGIWDSLGIEAARDKISAAGAAPGKGVRLAIMDGFFNPRHQVLFGASIIDRWDFVGARPDPWDSSGIDMHGTQTSGLVASSWDELPGIAPAVHLLLYRTEDGASETPAEEDNLAAAIVRACDSGAQVISISLGYRWFDLADQDAMHDWSAFDGKTLVASRAATAAARRNVLVVVSSGNEANKVGGMSIESPADADSILTVGAVDDDGARCSFSSFGPTYDGRRKPDVVAYGCPVPVADGAVNDRSWGTGTSFSAPLVAGMAVLARQLLPAESASDLVAQFRASGNRASAPGDSVGWGIPNLTRLAGLRSTFTSTRGTPLVYWSRGTVRFHSSATMSGNVGVLISDPTGRTLARWEGWWGNTGDGPIWDPSFFRAWRLRPVVAHWWGDYGEGSTSFVVHP